MKTDHMEECREKSYYYADTVYKASWMADYLKENDENLYEDAIR